VFSKAIAIYVLSRGDLDTGRGRRSEGAWCDPDSGTEDMPYP